MPRHTHLIHLGMMEHLLNLWIQVLHRGVGIRVPRRHTTHQCGGIHLRTRARYAHMPDQLMRHRARGSAGLAWGVRHARSHRVSWRRAGVLLHPGGMRREAWSHTSHHLQSCR